jgi:hypothetical protein
MHQRNAASISSMFYEFFQIILQCSYVAFAVFTTGLGMIIAYWQLVGRRIFIKNNSGSSIRVKVDGAATRVANKTTRGICIEGDSTTVTVRQESNIAHVYHEDELMYALVMLVVDGDPIQDVEDGAIAVRSNE